MKFEELGLSDEALRAVADVGYDIPTPIQEKAIPVILQGRDLFGVAQTGTGKTASFTLPMIDILAAGQAKARMPRTLVLEPTRELATQVAENFEEYGKYHKLSLALLIGGVRMDAQNKKVDRGVDVLIATPGRLLDHVDNGRLMLGGIKILVVDEGDRMLDMGFMPDVERIVGQLPPLHQTLLFSATMPPEIKRLAKKFLRNPREVSVAPPASTAEKVEQRLVVVDAREKRAALRNILREEKVGRALIFCNRKRDVGVLARSLKRHGFGAAELHGDLAQSVRTETLERFKNGEIDLLVASDVAARGLDIEGLPHVFNFDVPTHAEDYIHRIGRTARAGLSGHAITLAAPEDSKYVAAISALLGKDIPKVPAPGIEEGRLDDAKSGHRPRRNGRSSGGRGDRAGPRRGKSRGAEDEPRTPQKRTAKEVDATDEARKPRRAKSQDAPAKDEARKQRRAKSQDAPAKDEAQKSRRAKSQDAPAKDEAQKSRRARSQDTPPKGEAQKPRRVRPQDAHAKEKARPQGKGRSQRRDEDVIGLGDHVPAFLRRKP